MKSYTAYTQNDSAIITVLAEDIEDARNRVSKQLQSNPSRISYYRKWKSDGMIVKERKD